MVDRPSGPSDCLLIQAEISACIDAELNEAGVRRVLVHVEVCPSCRAFFNLLRAQVEVHRVVARDGPAASGVAAADIGSDPFAVDPFAGDLFEGVEAPPADLLASWVQDHSDRLAEVLYELGKAYILLTRSTEFFRILTREPVQIPEYRLRGRMILDGAAGSRTETDLPAGWVAAQELLDGRLDSVANNLDKGRRLLRESCQLRSTAKAQVWLGQSYLQTGEWVLARTILRGVLRQSGAREERDPVTKVPMGVYALESLGNLCLAQGKPRAALRYFRLVVASGAMDLHPNFSSGPTNVAYAALQIGLFDEAVSSLELVYDRFPWKRPEIGQRLALRTKVQRVLETNPGVRARLERTCPEWFGPNSQLVHGAKIQFEFVTGDKPALAARGAGTSPASQVLPGTPGA